MVELLIRAAFVNAFGGGNFRPSLRSASIGSSLRTPLAMARSFRPGGWAICLSRGILNQNSTILRPKVGSQGLPEQVTPEAGGACRRGDLRPAGPRHPLAGAQLSYCQGAVEAALHLDHHPVMGGFLR